MKKLFFLLFFLTAPAFAGTIPVTGTILLPNGSRFNGTVRMTLNFPGRDTCSGNITVPTEVRFNVNNGVIQTGAVITPNDCISPDNTIYVTRYFTSAGTLVMQNPFYISGTQINLGTAIPTTITSSNISFNNFTNLDNVTTKKINNVRFCDQFAGASISAKLTACIADLPATGGVMDARGFEGAQTFTAVVVLNKPVTLLLGATTITCPSNAPCLRAWDGSGTYDNIDIIGIGQGVTTLKTPSGATPGSTTRLNTIELHDPTDVTNTNWNDYIHIANLTLDGNKSNVTIPPGAASDDLTHNGLFNAHSRYGLFENLELKNYWFAGMQAGLYFQFNRVSNVYTTNNGYSTSVGYAGLQIGGTSVHNSIVNHVSDSDIIGAFIYDNARYNTLTGSTYRNDYHAVALSDQSGNSSYGNEVAGVTATNCGSQCLTVGNSGGTGIQRNSRFDVVIDTTTADPGVFIGINTTLCSFKLTVRRAYGAGVDLRGDYNSLDLVLAENSQQSALAAYALLLTGAASNHITAQIVDTQGTQTQRAVSLDATSNNNIISGHRTGSNGNVSDSGTGNRIDLPIDAGVYTVTNFNTSPIVYSSVGAVLGTAHVVIGSCVLGTSCAVTLTGSAVFTSTGSYVCTTNDETNANATKIVKSTGAAFTITGTGTDSIVYMCAGN